MSTVFPLPHNKCPLGSQQAGLLELSANDVYAEAKHVDLVPCHVIHGQLTSFPPRNRCTI